MTDHYSIKQLALACAPFALAVFLFSQPSFSAETNSGTPAAASNSVGNRPGIADAMLTDGADQCAQFIDKTGGYGAYGEIMKSALESNKRFQEALIDDKTGAIVKDEQMKAICPNFSKFKPDERVHFWIWTFAAISYDESRCKTKDVSNCSSGKCVGLMQMEETKSRRYWRGPSCNVPSVRSPEANLKCSLEILSGQFEGVYGRPPGLRKSYWEKLRYKNTSNIVKNRMKLYPGCGAANEEKAKPKNVKGKKHKRK